jgi:hypothetical protein
MSETEHEKCQVHGCTAPVAFTKVSYRAGTASKLCLCRRHSQTETKHGTL